MNRRALAVSALVLVVFLSGCTFWGSGGEIDEADLTQEATYNWETNATAAYNLSTTSLLSFSSDRYQAVIQVEEQDTLQVHRERTFRDDTSLEIESLQFRFTNGTVVNATHQNLTAVEESDYTEIRFPAENGSVGFTARWGESTWGSYGRSFRIPTFVEDSHEVTLPDGGRVGIPLLSRVTPGSDTETVTGDRLTLHWDDPDSSRLAVRYYQTRDLYVLGTLVGVASVVGIGGVAYYYRQIRRAQKKREDVGLDVDYEDDDFDQKGPPPGMR